MPHTGHDTITSDDFSEVAFSGDYNDLINKPSSGLTITVAYTNESVGNVGATTLSTKYPDYKLAIFINQINADGAIMPATTTILAKGHSAQAGPSWGTYYGRRTYTFASDGTISWTNYELVPVNPKYVYVIK